MGLKTDLIDAKIEGLRGSGATDEAILQAQEVLEVQTQLEVDAIVTFLENAKFRITNLAANVVLEDFKIPPVIGDIESSVTTEIPAGGVATTGGPIAYPVMVYHDKEMDQFYAAGDPKANRHAAVIEPVKNK